MRHLRSIGLATALVLAGLGHACLNDRDSAVAIQRQMYGDQQILTGWFDRNPPSYYQMRIERLEKLSKLSLAELDDLSVAYERIGETKNAMQLIDRKLKLGKPGYTYYANHGTFLIHDWLKSGSSDLAQAKQAEKEIARAIEINPEAHYGREGAQLEAIRWIIHLKSEKTKPLSLGEFMIRLTEETPTNESDLVEGLIGLVELGSAWESVDLFAGIAALAPGEPASDVALLRAKELLAAGKKPLFPEGVLRDTKRDVVDILPGASKEAFKIMRKDAERRTELRTDYMEERFAKGEHPDTHPGFWSGWKEPEKTPIRKRSPDNRPAWLVPSAGTAAIVLVAAIAFAFIRGRRTSVRPVN